MLSNMSEGPKLETSPLVKYEKLIPDFKDVDKAFVVLSMFVAFKFLLIIVHSSILP